MLTIALLLLIFYLPLCEAASGEPQPNIVLLFPDQWRWDWDSRHTDLAALNLKHISTLVAKGTTFEQAYVPAPVCAPSRACLASGREYDEAGVPTNFDNDYDLSIPTFFQSLQTAGYWTMVTGKDDLDKATQLGTRVGANWTGEYHQDELGFSDGLRCEGKGDVVDEKAPHERYGHFLQSHNVSLPDGEVKNMWDVHYSCMKNFEDGCEGAAFTQEFYEDDWVAERALELLNRRPDKTKPFFLWVSFPGPHPPFLVTAQMTNLTAGRCFPGAADNGESLPETCGASDSPMKSSTDRCMYGAEIENIDRLFGVVLAGLEAHERERTVVCFASDHGEMLLDHQDRGKTYPWQGSVSVPMACAGPGIAPGRVVRRPVATMDLAATFLDIAHATKPAGMTSQSLVPLMAGVDDEAYRGFVSSGLQSFAFSEAGELPTAVDWSWRLVVEAHTSLKFICCKGSCPGAPSNVPPVDTSTGFQQLLYNTSADPFDLSPLPLSEPAHAADAARLRALLPPSFGCATPLLGEALAIALATQDNAKERQAAMQRFEATDGRDWR